MLLLDRVRSLAGLGVRAGRAVRDVGVLHPVRPDRAARLLFPYVRFGPVPATVGAMSALRFPDRTALIDERGALTHAELEGRASALATALRERLGEDERVGVLCRNHRGFVETVLAASRLGNDVVLLNTDFSATQLGQVIEREGWACWSTTRSSTRSWTAPRSAGGGCTPGRAAERTRRSTSWPRRPRPSR